jgi:arginase family enzyme
MKLFTLNSKKVIEHLKDFPLTEAGILPIFDIKEIKDKNNIEKEIGENKAYCSLLGPDHSITYPGFKAFAKNNPGAGMIVFDAHPDEDFLGSLIEQGILDKNSIILVGIRSMAKEQKRFIDENRIKNYSMKEISFEALHEVADSVMSVARQWSKVYISIGLDVLDPTFAPGADKSEPGGMSTRDLLYFIQRLKMLRNIWMYDVVGFNPDKDVNDITAKVAAKILVELS